MKFGPRVIYYKCNEYKKPTQWDKK